MKLLMFYCPEFWFKPFARTLDSGEERPEEAEAHQAVVVFYHVEAEDSEKRSSVLTKATKNIKWLARKFGSTKVVLHSFNHLSSSKSDPDLASELVAEIRIRLENVGFQVLETPFGWLNEWRMHVGGESLAKVFKEL